MERRNEFVDILKGVAILCVIWGHSIQYSALDSFDFFENPVYKVIYSFHMPLLMIISGYLFYISIHKRNADVVLKNRIKNLAVPIVGGGAFIYYVIEIFNAFLTHQFYSIKSAGWIFSLDGLWFLWSVLSSTVIVGSIIARVSNNKQRILLYLCCTPFVYLFPGGDNNLFMYPYFISGYLICQYKYLMKGCIFNIKYYLYIVFIIMLLFFKREHYIYTSGILPFHSNYGFWGQIQIDIYRYAIGLIGSVALISLIKDAIKFSPVKVLKIFIFLGRNSLQIYILQKLVIQDLFVWAYKWISENLGYNILTLNMKLYNIVVIPLLILFFMIIINSILQVLNRSNLSKYIFGR